MRAKSECMPRGKDMGERYATVRLIIGGNLLLIQGWATKLGGCWGKKRTYSRSDFRQNELNFGIGNARCIKQYQWVCSNPPYGLLIIDFWTRSDTGPDNASRWDNVACLATSTQQLLNEINILWIWQQKWQAITLSRCESRQQRGFKKIEVSPNSYVKVTEYNIIIIWDDRMTSTAGAEGAEID